MSETVPAAAPLRSPTDRSPAAPLFLWLVLQLIALSLAVFRVPLSARFPLPGEQFALHIMLVVQIAGSALLFPFLLRDVKTSAMVILSIAPFVQLSSYLSSIPITRAALAALYIAVWLLTLAMWRVILGSRRSELLGVACATALSLGGAAIWYVRAEAREPTPIDWSQDGLLGPILGAISQLHAAPLSPWIVLVFLLALGAIVLYGSG
ncbi:MAG: hypothetical protein M3478_05070 [Planctomycetota bacterium]|nr:hypothetical protein [Planctomycetota bacterium]